MTEDSMSRKLGTIANEYDYGTFNWKIPNISSLRHEIDYVVQSPSFIFRDTSFIMKMFPYGQSKYESKGYMDFTIERLQPQTGEYRVLCTMYYKNEVNDEYVIRGGNYLFEPEWPQAKVLRFMPSLKRCPEKWNFVNDVFTLTFVFGKRFTAIKESDISTDSLVLPVGEKHTACEYVECQEIGKLFSDNFVSKTLIWQQKAANIVLSFPLPSDYQVLSPEFVFGRATWILKMYFLQKKNDKANIKMLLKRLHSEIPQHDITLKIKTYGKSFDASFCFDKTNREENTMDIPMDEELKNNVLKLVDFKFDIDIRMKKNTINELDSPVKLESPEKIHREKSKSSISTAKESTEKIPREKSKSSTSTTKESSGKKSREKSKSSTSTTKESLKGKQEKKAKVKEKPKISTSTTEESSEEVTDRENTEDSSSTTEESPGKIPREKSKSSTSTTKESSGKKSRGKSKSSTSTTKGDDRTSSSSTGLQTNEVIFYVILGTLIGYFTCLYSNEYKKK